MRRPVLYAAICEREPFTSDPTPTRDQARALAASWDEYGLCAHAHGRHPHRTAQVRRVGGRSGVNYSIIEGTIR